MHWKTIPPIEEPTPEVAIDLAPGPDSARAERNDLSNLDALSIVLFLIVGLLSGAFSVALLFRRIAIALAVTGPLLFSAVWVCWEWKKFGSKRFAFGAFAVGFTLTFLALDREP
ncbi:hypothetical protein J2P12_05595 [Candidatus Bathyarchaeota archaeon]|nr:hypothetical protein [Candidatus Bathyarchaeota archaeon]